VEALEVYRRARKKLLEELGLEPGPALQELERAILRHDAALQGMPSPAPARSILAVPLGAELDALLAVAEPLVRRPPRELIIVGIVLRSEDLSRATARLNKRREALVTAERHRRTPSCSSGRQRSRTPLGGRRSEPPAS